MRTIAQFAEQSRQFDDGLFPNWSDANIWDEAIKTGVQFAETWIPVTEELPPINEYITVKFIEWNGVDAYWTGIFHSETRRLHFLETHLKFTHWRLLTHK